jgi:ATP-binding cassette subfamily C (CFTR/MRP) protein 4
MFFLLGAPIIGIAATIMLYQLLGVAAFSAIATVFLMVPLQSFFSRKFRRATMGYTDQRVKVMKEILVGSHITTVNEIESLGRSCRIEAWNQGFFFRISNVSLHYWVWNFCVFQYRKNEVFSAVFLFSVIQQPFTGYFPKAVEGFSESRFSISRIENFSSASRN